MYCENCGHKLPEDAIFCPNCGHNIKNDVSSKILNLKNHWNRLPGEKKTLSIVVTCLIGLILLNGLAIHNMMTNVEEQVNDDSYSYVSYNNSDDDAYTTTLESDNPSSTQSSYSSDNSKSSHESQDSTENYGGSSSGGSYVGSVNSNKFHYSSCGQASKIKSGNLISFSSREDAISSGYSPCKFCNP